MKKNSYSLSNTSIEQAFHHILLHELKSIKRWRKKAYKGEDPEGVHQIRISLRRIRTALIVFKPIIDTKFSRYLSKKFKQNSKVLDDARDLDVFILTHFSDDSGDSSIKMSVKQQRFYAYLKVRKLLKSKQFNKQIRSCKKWLNKAKLHKQFAKKRHQVCSIESFAFRTLNQLRDVVITQGKTAQVFNDVELHRLRINCKKLRYTTEFFKTLYDKKVTKIFIRELKQLQDRLGEIHDCFIEKQLYQSLIKTNSETTLPDDSQKLLEKIERTGQENKVQVVHTLAHFCQCKYPWGNYISEK